MALYDHAPELVQWLMIRRIVAEQHPVTYAESPDSGADHPWPPAHWQDDPPVRRMIGQYLGAAVPGSPTWRVSQVGGSHRKNRT